MNWALMLMSVMPLTVGTYLIVGRRKVAEKNAKEVGKGLGPVRQATARGSTPASAAIVGIVFVGFGLIALVGGILNLP
jgi:hypothetical protein